MTFGNTHTQRLIQLIEGMRGNKREKKAKEKEEERKKKMKNNKRRNKNGPFGLGADLTTME